MGGQKVKFFSVIFMVLIVFSGCAAHKDYAPLSRFEAETYETKEKGAVSDRLLIWRASLTIEVDSVAETLPKVSSIIEKKDGYIENKWISGNDKDRATLTVRVPSNELTGVLDELSHLGKEKNRHLSSKDVTDQYIDTEARLKNALALRDRLRGLLDRAKEVKEIIEIEKELTRIQSEIDSMEGRLKKMKGQIDFASITLNLEEKTILGPLGYLFKGIGWVLTKLFVIN